MPTKKNLVIVESPAKAKTINKYLGKDYIVRSSVGHVRDLPVSGRNKATKSDPTSDKKTRAWNNLVRRMGVDPHDNWRANYEVLPDKTKVIKELRALAKDADTIFLATDLDREGEAIAWHLKETIGADDTKYSRVVFNEITKNAIQQAFLHPTTLNMDKVNAQQARRFLDRVVGFMVSPLLWQKVARGLSAGRVQSVATRLVVEREQKIRAFVPVEFWQVHVDLIPKGAEEALHFEAVEMDGAALSLSNADETQALVDALHATRPVVSQIDERPISSRTAVPFITSTLQQAASTRLGFSVKKTMVLAQRLYEAGHISYMRTDSVFLSKDAIDAARDYIAQHHNDALPDAPQHYGNKKNAQEAHEAIRPTYAHITASMLGVAVDADAKRLYDLIWRQFIACQMLPARYMTTKVQVSADNVRLLARGRRMIFAGDSAVLGQKSSDVLLPKLEVNTPLDIADIVPSQHFTKPPARFTEASLVKELEKEGIGRPSTYASIISTIQDRGYVRAENKRLYAQKMGDIVTDRLIDSFPELMDYEFTAALERTLDEVAGGQIPYLEVLDAFYKDFEIKLEAAKGKGGMRPNDPTDVPDITCDLCGREMQIRTGQTGVFLGCTGYHLPPKDRCTGTKNLMPAEVFSSQIEHSETDDLLQKRRCPKCNTAMDAYIVDGARKLHVCGNNPDCDGYLVEQGVFETKSQDDSPTLDCDKCDGQMTLKTGRFGAYFACNACKNTRKLLKNGEIAPVRMSPIDTGIKSQKHDDYFLLREGAAGLFLAASKFPKIRETRAPKVAELRALSDALPKKFHYLLDAPLTDEEGNPTILRWSRKQSAQYIGSEKQGKATRFALWHQGGKWIP